MLYRRNKNFLNWKFYFCVILACIKAADVFKFYGSVLMKKYRTIKTKLDFVRYCIFVGCYIT